MLASTRDPTTLAKCFHALSDEKRLRILDLLRRGERCVCDLTEALDVGQSLLSFHLRTLKDAGIVSDRRRGRWVFYALIPEALDGLREHLEQTLEEVGDAQGITCCG